MLHEKLQEFCVFEISSLSSVSFDARTNKVGGKTFSRNPPYVKNPHFWSATYPCLTLRKRSVLHPTGPCELCGTFKAEWNRLQWNHRSISNLPSVHRSYEEARFWFSYYSQLRGFPLKSIISFHAVHRWERCDALNGLSEVPPSQATGGELWRSTEKVLRSGQTFYHKCWTVGLMSLLSG